MEPADNFNRAARPLPNECPLGEWNPHRNASSSAESNIDTGPFHAAACPSREHWGRAKDRAGTSASKTVC